jgi:hypothetical protein
MKSSDDHGINIRLEIVPLLINAALISAMFIRLISALLVAPLQSRATK